MKKKFICAVCGYIYEGAEAPEKCPICKAPASKFSELKEDGETTYATVHKIGDGKLPGADEEMINDLRNHFNGECGEVGMYLAMARQADREGYPEIAEAFKRYAFEESCLENVSGTQRPTSRSVRQPKLVLVKTSSALRRTLKLPVWMQSTIPFTKWQRTKHVTAQALQVC